MPTSSCIAAIGVALPSLRLPIEELAKLRGAEPAKYTSGLGCIAQSLCSADQTHVDLGIQAAGRALAQWGGSLEDIGLIAVGTECALDMARPLSAWISDALGLPETARSYEVKHACYAGTLALRHAVEWQRSGASRGKSALIVCADEAWYAPEHPGEPTQGACAIALVVAPEGFAEVGLYSYAFQLPAFDFWREVGQAYPEVDGPLSIQCYKDAFRSCVQQWRGDSEAFFAFEDVDAWAMHAPFPKMAQKGFVAAQSAAGVDESAALRHFQDKVMDDLLWNRRVGNCYTASAWLSFAHVVGHSSAAQNIALFSYGSGVGAELLLIKQHRALESSFAASVEAQFDAQKELSIDDYVALRHLK